MSGRLALREISLGGVSYHPGCGPLGVAVSFTPVNPALEVAAAVAEILVEGVVVVGAGCCPPCGAPGLHSP